MVDRTTIRVKTRGEGNTMSSELRGRDPLRWTISDAYGTNEVTVMIFASSDEASSWADRQLPQVRNK
jgi:hypothetical protein